MLDITGLAHLFGGETALAEAIVRDFARFGRKIRVVVADTIGAAWAVANYCNLQFSIGHPFVIVPPGGAPALLRSLPIEALRLSEETLRLLHELGVARIGQLEVLPRAELSSRFEPTLQKRMDQACGRLDELVLACPIPPRFTADWSAEHPTGRRETIEAALEHLVRRVAAMLARRDRGALQLDCRLDLEIQNRESNPRNVCLSVGLFQPTAAAERLLPLVQLQLEQLRIPSPVTHVCVTAALTAPLELRKQTTLFDLVGDGADRTHARRLAALVERLSSRLGHGAVAGVRLRPEAQPELSWHYDPLVGRARRCGAQKPLPAELPPRPLRLLPRPWCLDATSIAPDGPPLRFHVFGVEHRIAQSWGPERIETGWWRGRPIGRDYFRVATAAGRRFWLFRRLRDGKWFLHGMFE